MLNYGIRRLVLKTEVKMRINPISLAHIPTNNVPRSTAAMLYKRESMTKQNLSFGASWGGAIGTLIGTFAGVGLGVIATVATGGLAVPIIAGMAGAAAGGIGGDILDNKIKKDSKQPPGNGGSGGEDVDTAFENARLNNY